MSRGEKLAEVAITWASVAVLIGAAAIMTRLIDGYDFTLGIASAALYLACKSGAHQIVTED